jgi:hypothetical protein
MIPRDARELLLCCLHADSSRLAVDTLPDADSQIWDEWLHLSTWQRVRSLLYYHLKQRHLERRLAPRMLQPLRLAFQQTTMRNLRLLEECGETARALAAENVPVIVLKGGYLIGAVYREVGLREMSDLDIMVRPEHLPRAADVVRARGYKPLQPFQIDDDRAVAMHLTPFVMDGGARIEIHWNITPPLDPHAINPEDLWHRAVPWSSGNISALGLCIEDLLLHLCFHASFQHCFRFVGIRPCCDVATILVERGPSIDWELLIYRAQRWRWAKGVYLSLRLARDLIGAAVPDSVLHALHPAGVDRKVLEAAADQIFTPQWLPEGVARLAGQEPTSVRLRSIGPSILLPRSEMRARRRESWRSLYLFWVRLARGGYLLRTHGRSVFRLLFKTDRTLSATAERMNRIRSWLALPDNLSH